MARAPIPSGIPYDVLGYLINRVNTLKLRIARLHQPPLEYPDYLALFLQENEVADVLRARPLLLAKSHYELHYVWVGENRVVFHHRSDTDVPQVLIPKGDQLRPDAPPELVGRVHRWVEALRNNNYDFSRVETIINWLSCHCTHRAQLRYLWPSLLTLCAQIDNEAVKTFAQSLQAARVPSTLPELPPQMREVLRAGADTVATAALLPEEDVGPPPPFFLAIHRCPPLSDGLFTYEGT